MKNFPIWKQIEETYSEDIIKLMYENNIKVSDWILDIFERIDKFISVESNINLAKVSLRELEFKGPTKLEDFYTKALENNLSFLTPQEAMLARVAYKNQPSKEWLRIATALDAMIDSDGVPHLPKMGYALSNFYVETYWAWPNAIFHPHNEFILKLNS